MRLLPPLIILASILCSCTAPRVAPRFTSPSTVGIHQSVDQIAQHTGKARDIVSNLKTQIAKTPDAKLSLAQPYVDSLLTELNTVYSENDQLKGQVGSLDTQLKDQTVKANNLADAYDKSAQKIQTEHKWVVRWFKLFAISALVNIVAIGWIFRKPIMLAAAGFGV